MVTQLKSTDRPTDHLITNSSLRRPRPLGRAWVKRKGPGEMGEEETDMDFLCAYHSNTEDRSTYLVALVQFNNSISSIRMGRMASKRARAGAGAQQEDRWGVMAPVERGVSLQPASRTPTAPATQIMTRFPAPRKTTNSPRRDTTHTVNFFKKVGRHDIDM